MRLESVLMAIAIIGGFGTTIYFFTKVMTDYILKKKMIEKGFVNDDTQAIFKQHTADNRFSALKWGLIVFFGGLSLIIMEFIPRQAIHLFLMACSQFRYRLGFYFTTSLSKGKF